MNEHDNNTTGAIAAALAKVQADLPDIERDRTVEVEKKAGGTYSYSYVTLANLSKAVLPLLATNGLSFAAMPGTGSDGKMCLRYTLMHESGERLDGEFPISGEGGIQMVGGRITYARRYCLAALVGVAADEDDESTLAADAGPAKAQRAAKPQQQAGQAPAKKIAQRQAKKADAPPLPSDKWTMTNAQRGALMANFADLGVTERDDRLKLAGEIVGRELSSANDLADSAEFKKLMDGLDERKEAPFTGDQEGGDPA